ncbi:MAG TPA: hypothetical protein VIX91_15490 [Candidatus Acidoferrum sp.]
MNVVAEGRVFMCPGGSDGTTLLRANFEQLREPLIAGGHINRKEFDQDWAAMSEPGFLMPSSILWSVRGRRPKL